MTKRDDSPRCFYLRERRVEKGLTQEAVALGVGTTKSMISMLETGAHAYNERWVLKISEFLEILPIALFTPPGEPLPAQNDEALRRVFVAWPRIPDRQKVALANLAETFIEAPPG